MTDLSGFLASRFGGKRQHQGAYGTAGGATFTGLTGGGLPLLDPGFCRSSIVNCEM